MSEVSNMCSFCLNLLFTLSVSYLIRPPLNKILVCPKPDPWGTVRCGRDFFFENML